MTVVRVDQMGGAIRMAGQVKLDDPITRDVANVLGGVEVVVDARDVDVVHVEEASRSRLPPPSGS